MKYSMLMALMFAYVGLRAQTFDKERYDSLSAAFDKGTLEFAELPWMIKKAEQFRQQDRAKKMADSYTVRLLDKIDSIGYRKEDLQMLMNYIHSSKDPGFVLFLKRPEKVDATLQAEGAARARVDYVIAREEIDAKLWKDGRPLVSSPDWTSYTKNITKRYGKHYADKPILGAKVRWYQSEHDDHNYIKYQLEFLQKYGMEKVGYKAMVWNNFLFNDVFKKSTDEAQLSLALSFAKQLLDYNPTTSTIMDTYANLLYKLGRKSEALEWQQKAYALTPDDDEIKGALELMKEGKPTW